jgi:hypothetical protein
MSEFWKIEENVGPGFITWDGIFGTREKAWEHAVKTLGYCAAERVRTARYVTGKWNGPVRRED